MFNRLLLQVLLAVTLTATSSCVYESIEEIQEVPQAQDVYVTLSVSTAEGSATLSRADDYSFDHNPLDNELIHSLRVYILRPDNTLEARRYVTLSSEGVPVMDNLVFKVIGDETKTILVFANTESLDDDAKALFKDLDNITVPDADNGISGGEFPLERVRNFTISRKSDSSTPLFEEGQHIPMSEEFRFFFNSSDKYQGVDLFITRASVKFSFYMSVPENYDVYDTGLTVDIAIDNIAKEEFLLPRDATYVPAKYVPAPRDEREIISYTVPSSSSPASFYIDKAGVFSPGSSAGSPELLFVTGPVYLPETACYTNSEEQSYSVRIRFQGDGVDGEWHEAVLPNLPRLPRNTHVQVYITVSLTGEPQCTVRLVPYGSIELDPVFGL